jgi:putative tryptophan/tyrosine transport system substrate-binding protein
MMRRREFITGLGSAAAWPGVARGQQGERVRRVGMLMQRAESDPVDQSRIALFRQTMLDLGWTEGRNLQMHYRWSAADNDRLRTNAAELAALGPDVLVGAGAAVRPLLRATRTVPIVFAGVNDPVGGGLVVSLARPGGNITGFGFTEYGFSEKWLELLKQIAPSIMRVTILFDPNAAGGLGQMGSLQSAANLLKVELTPIDVSDARSLERLISEFASRTAGGVVVTGTLQTNVRRDLIISLAAQHKLPAVYPGRQFVDAGGLISYGAATADLYRRAAGYVDRILRGEKPADLPVQTPSKYELVVNLKTAKALGLTLPQSILLRADEVIE